MRNQKWMAVYENEIDNTKTESKNLEGVQYWESESLGWADTVSGTVSWGTRYIESENIIEKNDRL